MSRERNDGEDERTTSREAARPPAESSCGSAGQGHHERTARDEREHQMAESLRQQEGVPRQGVDPIREGKLW